MISLLPPFGRVVTAMATPFTRDGALDADGAARLAEHLVDNGTETVLIAGTTGEGPTLDRAEKLDLLAAVRAAVGERAKVMLGTGTYDTAESCSMTEAATAAGADAVLAVTPYYSRPSQRGLVAHFTAIAESTDRPVLLYDIPSRTAREIETETLLSLAQVDNIVAVKDAVGSLAKTAEIVARAPSGFSVYCGDDVLFLPSLAVGAVGVVSVASHLVGTELQDLATTFESDPTKAREIHARLLPIFRALFVDSNPVPLKAALRLLGLPGGPVRPPLADADDDTVGAMRTALAATGVS